MIYKAYFQLAIIIALISAMVSVFPFSSLIYTTTKNIKNVEPICSLVRLDAAAEQMALNKARTSWQRGQESIGDRVDLMSTSLPIMGIEEVVVATPKTSMLNNERIVYHPNIKPELFAAPAYERMTIDTSSASELPFSREELLKTDY